MTKQEFLNALPTAVHIKGNWTIRRVHVDGQLLDAAPSQRVQNHSPDGFNWGYAGSGPAQLALALLLLYVDAYTAVQYYQDFKHAWVAYLPQADFEGTYNIREIMRIVLGMEDPDLYTTKE